MAANPVKPSQHTPGPWRVGNNGAIVADHEHGHVLDEDSQDFYGGKVFVCESVTGADARLIAAAPKLLEALQAIIDCFFVGSQTPEQFIARVSDLMHDGRIAVHEATEPTPEKARA